MPFIYSIKKQIARSERCRACNGYYLYAQKNKFVVSMEKAEGEGDCKGEREELSL